MKNITFVLIATIFFTSGYSQNWVKLKNNRTIKDIKIWEINESHIVYESNECLHDLPEKDIEYLIYNDTLIRSRSNKLVITPFDSVITIKSDTIKCIITKIENKRIYFKTLSYYYDNFKNLEENKINKIVSGDSVVVFSNTQGFNKTLLNNTSAAPGENTKIDFKERKDENDLAEKNFIFPSVVFGFFPLQLISEKLQLEVGIEIKLTGIIYSTMDVGFIGYPAGFSVRPGIKYYYKNIEFNNRHKIQRSYLSVNYVYKCKKDYYLDNNDFEFNLEKNDVQCLNIIIGLQRIYKSNFTLDIFGGPGIRYGQKKGLLFPNLHFGIKLGFVIQ